MRKIVALAALLALGANCVQPVHAQGRDVAAGLVGGLIGGAIGGAIVSGAQPAPPPQVYYAPPPPQPVYVEEPAPCHWAQERVWDGYAWQIRRIQVCN